MFTQTLPTPPSPASAAARHRDHILHIQRVWRRKFRHNQTHQLVADFFEHGPTTDRVKGMSFENLVITLREKRVIAISKACLQRIHLLTTFRHGSPPRALAPENVNVRVFLAGYMIAYRSTHVFESMGALEHALLDAATPLLTKFQEMCTVLREKKAFSAVPPEMSQNFPTLLFEYLKRFKAWKVPDEAKLTCRIKHALVALYQAEEHLPPDEPEDSKLKIEFRTQIERLRSKLQQIAGVDALRKFDDDRLSGALTGACAPPPGGDGDGRGKGGGGPLGALPGRMTNEQLAHELLLDPEFQLDEDGGCSVNNPVFNRIRDSFHQAFWVSLVDDLRLATPCYARVLRVLSEIRDGILDLTGTREVQALREAVDLDFIKQQAEAGLFSWVSSVHLVHALLQAVQRSQAPKRDEETRTRFAAVDTLLTEAASSPEDQPRAFCKALEFLLDRINAMRIDAANARLRLIAPVIKDHGIDYERGKLQDKINDGTLTLQRTEAWIDSSVRQTLLDAEVDPKELLEGKARAFVYVHSAAMLELVTSSHTVVPEVSPETLLFDVHRLAMLQREFQLLVMSTTVLITLAHYLKGDEAELVPRIGEEILKPLQELDTGRMAEAIGELLLVHLPEDRRKGALNVVTQCTSPVDMVHKIVGRRMRTVVAAVMSSGQGRVLHDTRFLQAAKPLFGRIEGLATKLMALANLNRTVHLPTYNKLIGKAALDHCRRPEPVAACAKRMK